jgi:hypothetical protein
MRGVYITWLGGADMKGNVCATPRLGKVRRGRAHPVPGFLPSRYLLWRDPPGRFILRAELMACVQAIAEFENSEHE